MFDWNQHLRETAQHLVRLHGLPGWEDYAVHRAQELAADPLYSELPALIRELRKATTAQAGS